MGLPSKMGMFGVVSPRTCGDCLMVDTLWWKLMNSETGPNTLSARDKETLHRITNEPQSILVE